MAKSQADTTLHDSFGPFEPRIAAVGAMFIARGDKKKAVKEFKALTKTMVAKPKRFIATWWDKFNRTWSLQSEKPTGRPPTMSELIAMKASKLLKRGYVRAGVQHKYSSIQQAMKKNTALSNIKDSLGISKKTMLQRMKAVDANLIKHKQDKKPELSDEQKQARLHAATHCLQRVQDLNRVIFVDAKHFFISAADNAVYMDISEVDHVVTTTQGPTKPKPAIKLYYYAAVNAKVGLVHIEFCTGTTKLNQVQPRRKVYKVCSHHLQKLGVYITQPSSLALITLLFIADLMLEFQHLMSR
jgi:hypothetical protein